MQHLILFVHTTVTPGDVPCTGEQNQMLHTVFWLDRGTGDGRVAENDFNTRTTVVLKSLLPMPWCQECATHSFHHQTVLCPWLLQNPHLHS